MGPFSRTSSCLITPHLVQIKNQKLKRFWWLVDTLIVTLHWNTQVSADFISVSTLNHPHSPSLLLIFLQVLCPAFFSELIMVECFWGFVYYVQESSYMVLEHHLMIWESKSFDLLICDANLPPRDPTCGISLGMLLLLYLWC